MAASTTALAAFKFGTELDVVLDWNHEEEIISLPHQKKSKSALCSKCHKFTADNGPERRARRRDPTVSRQLTSLYTVYGMSSFSNNRGA